MGGALSGLGGLVSQANDWAMNAAEFVAPVAQMLGDVAAAMGAVCGVLALVPGLQGLGVVALALSVVALAGHYTAMVGSTRSFVEPFTRKKMLTTLAVDGIGLVAGVKAYQAGREIEDIVAISGQPTRTVAKFGIGRMGIGTQEVPVGFFEMAKSGYPMGSAEFGHRIVRFQGAAAGNVLTLMGGRDTRETFTHLDRVLNPMSTPLPK